MGRKIINEMGNTYGFLEVFAWGKKDKYGKQEWWCYCHNDGNFCEVVGNSLRNGNTKSCGCYRRERVSEVHTGKKLSEETRRKISEAEKGENHHNWNPNLTNEEREANNTRTTTPEYREWRSAVFARDNYTCQISGQRGHLNAHHIKNWAEHPELRYDPNNGITIMDEHHKNFHSLFGYKNNNPGQLWALMLTV